MEDDQFTTVHVILLSECKSPLRKQLKQAGWEKPDGLVPKNNNLTIIAYLTLQTIKMLITLPVMHQFVGLPVQLQNRLHSIHY